MQELCEPKPHLLCEHGVYIPERAALLKAATNYNPNRGTPFLAMTVFADWLDENGEHDLAYAYRWAGKRERFPWISPQGKHCTWERQGKLSVLPIERPWELPWVVFDALQCPFPTWATKETARAFEVLAVALRVVRSEVQIPD